MPVVVCIAISRNNPQEVFNEAGHIFCFVLLATLGVAQQQPPSTSPPNQTTSAKTSLR